MDTKARVAEARRLLKADQAQAALNLLLEEMFDHGLTPELHTSIQKLFPVTPEVERELADFEARLSSSDAKVRQTAARAIARIALGEHSNRALHLLRHSEASGLLIRHLENPDPVVRENMTIALAMAFLRYTLDARAFQPLLAQLKSKSINTRAWAIEALLRLSDDAVEHVLPLLNDKSARVRTSVLDELASALAGGGTLPRPPLGPAGRQRIREAMLHVDRDRDADSRRRIANLLAWTAEPEDLPTLQAWFKQDRSKDVKAALQAGINRLRAEALSAETGSKPAKNPKKHG